MKASEVMAQYLAFAGAQYAVQKAVPEYTRLVYAPINAKEKGVVGDGVTDDTANINLLFSSYISGKIYFPPGNYVVSNTSLISNSNIVVELDPGAHIKPTFIDKDVIRIDGTNDHIIGFGSIDNPAQWNAVNTTWTHAVIEVYGSGCSVNQITMNNVPRIGVGFRSNDGIVNNCKIYCNLPLAQYNVNNTNLYGIAYDPPGGNPDGNFICMENIISGAMEGVFVGNYGTGTGYNIDISHNTFTDCYDHAVYSLATTGINCSHNVILNTKNGIIVSGPNNVVESNIITANANALFTDFGVSLSLRDGRDNKISGNIISLNFPSGAVVVDIKALVGTDISENIISENIIISGSNPVTALRLINNVATGSMNRNKIKDNIVSGVPANISGLIQAIGPSTNYGTDNDIIGNKVIVTGFSPDCYGIQAEYLLYGSIKDNSVLIEGSAGVVSNFRHYQFDLSMRVKVKDNKAYCLGSYGANLNITGYFEASTCSDNLFKENECLFTSVAMTSKAYYGLNGANGDRSRNKNGMAPMSGEATIATGTNIINVPNINVTPSSKIMITPKNYAGALKNFYVIAGDGTFSINPSDGANVTAPSIFNWEIL